jgi:hypothetical protein
MHKSPISALFLQEWFNPKINSHVQAFRDHIAKMQQTAFDDRAFICDPLDRFFARKYENLKREIPSFIESATGQHDSQIVELTHAISESNQMIAFMLTQLRITDSEFVAMEKASHDNLKVALQTVHAQAQKLLDNFWQQIVTEIPNSFLTAMLIGIFSMKIISVRCAC